MKINKDYIEATTRTINDLYTSGKHNFEIDSKATFRKKARAICLSQKGGCVNCPLADHKNSVCKWEIIKDIICED